MLKAELVSTGRQILDGYIKAIPARDPVQEDLGKGADLKPQAAGLKRRGRRLDVGNGLLSGWRSGIPKRQGRFASRRRRWGRRCGGRSLHRLQIAPVGTRPQGGCGRAGGRVASCILRGASQIRASPPISQIFLGTKGNGRGRKILGS